MVERLVRIFFLAAWLFHRSQARAEIALYPHHPPALLGIIIFHCERQRSPSRHLWRVGVQRLVGFYFSLAVLGFAFPNRIRVVRDLCFSVVEGP